MAVIIKGLKPGETYSLAVTESGVKVVKTTPKPKVLFDVLSGMEPWQKVKVGATNGEAYFYIGYAYDLTKMLNGFGMAKLRLRPVDLVRDADPVIDPDVRVIMIQGGEKGRFWATDEAPDSSMLFRGQKA